MYSNCGIVINCFLTCPEELSSYNKLSVIKICTTHSKFPTFFLETSRKRIAILYVILLLSDIAYTYMDKVNIEDFILFYRILVSFEIGQDVRYLKYNLNS